MYQLSGVGGNIAILINLSKVGQLTEIILRHYVVQQNIPGPLSFVPMDGNKVNVILTVQVQVTSVQILGLLMLSVHTGSATTPWMSCTTADHHQQSTMIDIGEIKSPPLNFQ